jgi:carbon monoxide dehydrogenase subunit G
MPTFETSIEIAASPETVWSIIADPSHATKVMPDLISVTTDPPGMAQLGQKVTMTAKVAGRKVQTIGEYTEVIPNKKLASKGLPGGFLKSMVSSTTLEPTKKGTRVTMKTEYEASAGYLGKVLSVLVVNRAMKKNLQVSGYNLKELAELKELPPHK